MWYTAVVDGTSFPAENSAIFTVIPPDSTAISSEVNTFPGLTVTSLTPGKALQMYWEVTYMGADSAGSNYDIFVPRNAIPLKAAAVTDTTTKPTLPTLTSSIATSTSTPTPTSESSADSSLNARAIGALVIGGIVLLASISGLVYYKLGTRRRKKRAGLLASLEHNGDVDGHPANSLRGNDYQPQVDIYWHEGATRVEHIGLLRYPQAISEGLHSANTRDATGY